jgi:hypothetical protein
MINRTRFVFVALIFSALVAGVVAQTQNRFPGKVIVESSASDSLTVAGGGSFGDSVTVSGTTVTVSNGFPRVAWNETAAALDSKYWRMLASSATHTFSACNDAVTICTPIWSIARSTTVPSMTLGVAGAGLAELHVEPTVTTGGINFDNGGARITGNANAGSGFFQFIINGSGTVALQLTNSLATFKAAVFAQVAGIPATFDRTGSDGTIVSLRQDSTEEGTISVAGTTVSYNAFMGSHYTQLEPGQVAPATGTVVVTTGREIPSRVAAAEKFVFVEPSRERNARGTFGVWWASLNRTADGMSWGDPTREVFQVAGLGLVPGVLVTDTCGPIRKGDLLGSSPRAGLAERQCHPSGQNRYDPLVRDTTLGKAVVDVDFSKVKPDAAGVRKVLVPAVLYAG